MINANELRQGNWVIENTSYHQIEYRDSDWFHCDLFEPIPLTPEILEKCVIEEVLLNKLIENGSIGRQVGKPFKYLHQLQNLYFAITGEELKVNFTQLVH